MKRRSLLTYFGLCISTPKLPDIDQSIVGRSLCQSLYGQASKQSWLIGSVEDKVPNPSAVCAMRKPLFVGDGEFLKECYDRA
jgi:hypothetical protein